MSVFYQKPVIDDSDEREVLNTIGSNFIFNTITLTKIPNLEFPVKAGKTYRFKFTLIGTVFNATPDIRLQVTGPATGTTGVTTYTNAENAISITPSWGVISNSIALATGSDNNADNLTADGWLKANADGVVEINVRNNSGTISQTLSALSWVEAKQID